MLQAPHGLTQLTGFDVLDQNLAITMMAVSGVRSSWLMAAKKSLLALLAEMARPLRVGLDLRGVSSSVCFRIRARKSISRGGSFFNAITTDRNKFYGAGQAQDNGIFG